ncbi:MAG: 50S ribosomal protein L4 [Bacteroidales bacterium]|nr:50S ribosomal protein L4 [Bacteroidales bacterium]MBN2757395.1 50S ribosomal protein L4 [Bacteroidales bacterium]
MELKVYNIKGEETGSQVTLDDTIFAIEPNDHALYLDVKHYMANNRQGTHKSKERAEVAGSTRKIKKQKGTGTARAGSIKSPVFRGGGRVFGPRPKDYSFKLNKKIKQLARKSALSYKAKEEKIIILENFNFDTPNTSEYLAIKNNLKIADKKTLLVLQEPNKNIYLSSRNLKGSKTVIASELTTYDILDAKTILFVEGSLDVLEKMF